MIAQVVERVGWCREDLGLNPVYVISVLI